MEVFLFPAGELSCAHELIGRSVRIPICLNKTRTSRIEPPIRLTNLSTNVKVTLHGFNPQQVSSTEPSLVRRTRRSIMFNRSSSVHCTFSLYLAKGIDRPPIPGKRTFLCRGIVKPDIDEGFTQFPLGNTHLLGQQQAYYPAAGETTTESRRRIDPRAVNMHFYMPASLRDLHLRLPGRRYI